MTQGLLPWYENRTPPACLPSKWKLSSAASCSQFASLNIYMYYKRREYGPGGQPISKKGAEHGR